MTDTSNWNYLYKRHYVDNTNETTNMMYTPMINPEGDTLCMIWDESHPYQEEEGRTPLTSKLINFFFKREVENLLRFQEYSWAPKIKELDLENRRVYIEWHGESINQIIMSGKDLNKLCPDWKEQIFNIVKDIYDSGYYKLALYPHCFFIDANNCIKTIDFYSCVSIEERYIHRDNLVGMIGNSSTDRFNQATDGEQVDFKVFFDITMNSALSKTWIYDNPFPEFYKRLT